MIFNVYDKLQHAKQRITELFHFVALIYFVKIQILNLKPQNSGQVKARRDCEGTRYKRNRLATLVIIENQLLHWVII